MGIAWEMYVSTRKPAGKDTKAQSCSLKIPDSSSDRYSGPGPAGKNIQIFFDCGMTMMMMMLMMLMLMMLMLTTMTVTMMMMMMMMMMMLMILMLTTMTVTKTSDCDDVVDADLMMNDVLMILWMMLAVGGSGKRRAASLQMGTVGLEPQRYEKMVDWLSD